MSKRGREVGRKRETERDGPIGIKGNAVDRSCSEGDERDRDSDRQRDCSNCDKACRRAWERAKRTIVI